MIGLYYGPELTLLPSFPWFLTSLTLDRPFFKILLHLGADINHRDEEGSTPLHQ
jgi:ankyrin repeat protein